MNIGANEEIWQLKVNEKLVECVGWILLSWQYSDWFWQLW